MRFCLMLILAFALFSESVAHAQYNGSGYSDSDSSSGRISGRGIGKLIGLVVAGFIALCSFIWRAATGSGGSTDNSSSVARTGPAPDFSALSGTPPSSGPQGPPRPPKIG
jgi:hypothetical protein